uniref:CSON000888 protein n=1 Tax=Culicoides sonorensis TaxID=179676 RepID=A0A336MFH4_CULSO
MNCYKKIVDIIKARKGQDYILLVLITLEHNCKGARDVILTNIHSSKFLTEKSFWNKLHCYS